MKQILGFSIMFLAITATAQSYTPLYENRDCPYFIRRLADDRGADISCGYLVVPEDRKAIDSNRLIKLHVVRIAAKQPTGHAPLIYLHGGTGRARNRTHSAHIGIAGAS